jgi:hypothetical protein
MTEPRVLKAVMRAENSAADRHNQDVLVEVRDALNRVFEPGCAFIAQSSYVTQNMPTPNVFYEFSGTFAESGTTDSRLTVHSSGVGVTYGGTVPCRMVVALSFVLSNVWTSLGLSYVQAKAYVNDSPNSEATGMTIFTDTNPNGVVSLNAALDIEPDDAIEIKVGQTLPAGLLTSTMSSLRSVFTLVRR